MKTQARKMKGEKSRKKGFEMQTSEPVLADHYKIVMHKKKTIPACNQKIHV